MREVLTVVFRSFIAAAGAALLVLAIASLTGCGSSGDTLKHPATHVVVRAGVAELIDGEAEAARSVIAWTEDAMAVMDGNPTVLLVELRERATELIPWNDMSPARQIIAIEVLRYVEAQAVKRVEDGELPPEAVMTLRELVETARWAAEFQLAIATQ